MPWGVSRINRIGFMAEMNNLLLFMDDEDRQRVLKRYDSMFDQAGAEGEETLLRCLGSPVRQVLQIEQEYRDAVDKGKTPFADMDISLPTSGLEEYWQPNDDSARIPQPIAEAHPEGVRSIPLDPAEPSTEPVIPEETPMEELPESESLPPEPVPREEDISPIEPEDDAAPIPEIVPEEIIAPEIPAPPEEKTDDVPALSEEKTVSAPEPAAEIDRDPEEKDRKPGAGRIIAAFFATIPMLVMWVLFFAVSLALGAAVLALGAAFAAIAIYLMSYLFSRMITYIPDVMLVAGGVLVALGLALLLIWCGLWIAVGGCALTVRISRGIYRSILGVEEED